MSDDSTAQCEYRTTEVPIGCSCGARLENSTRDYQNTIEATRDGFDELRNPASPFSFCYNSLLTLGQDGQGYEIRRQSIALLGHLEMFTNSTLAQRIQQLEKELLIFRQVLDRTITGLLVETDLDKYYCFVSVASIQNAVL